MALQIPLAGAPPARGKWQIHAKTLGGLGGLPKSFHDTPPFSLSRATRALLAGGRWPSWTPDSLRCGGLLRTRAIPPEQELRRFNHVEQ